MTHGKMDAIQVDDAVVIEQPALAPGFLLLGQRLVETAHGAGAGGHSQQFFGHFAHLMGTGAADKHVRQRLRNLGFIAAIALKHLRMKGSGAISGDFEVLNAPSRGHEIAGVGPIAIPTARGSAFPSRGSDALLQFFTHDLFD
jgi:hypothetical protein